MPVTIKKCQFFIKKDQFYRIYYQARQNQHGPKEGRGYSKLARTRERYAVKIVPRVLQLLQEVHYTVVKEY